MSLTKRLGLIVGAAASLSTVAMAQSTNLDQSRAFANELYSDSSGRASALAGPGFKPEVYGYTQFRLVVNNRGDEGAALNGNPNNLPAGPNGNNTSTLTAGFENARTVVGLKGNVGTEDWGYNVSFLAGPGGGSALYDSYGTYKIGNGWGLKFGQFQQAFAKENMMADTAQLAIDRSVTDGFFGTNRVQGIEGMYSADAFRIMATVSDGRNSRNTDYTAEGADFGLTGRGEFMWAGKWDQADQFTSWQNSGFFGMVGAGLDYENGGATVGSGLGGTGSKFQLVAVTADVMVKGNGWNAFAAGHYGHIDHNPGATDATGNFLKTDDLGLVLQGGIFVAPQWELFGRLDAIFADSNWNPAPVSVAGGGGTYSQKDTFAALTLGANYYVVPDSQAVKLSAEVEIFLTKPNGPANAGGNTLNGLLNSPDGKSGQFMVAAQAQLVF